MTETTLYDLDYLLRTGRSRAWAEAHVRRIVRAVGGDVVSVTGAENFVLARLRCTPAGAAALRATRGTPRVEPVPLEVVGD